MDAFKKSVTKFGKKIEEIRFITKAGRVIFAATFIISAWQEYRGFDVNGGLTAEQFRPKLGFFSNQAKYLVAVGIAMKALGGLAFIFDTYFGAILLLIYQAIVSPILYDFYNCDFDRQEFTLFYTKFKEFLNDTMSTDGGVAVSFYNSFANQESRQKLADQLNEIARLAISNPLFTPSEFNKLFMRFIKGFGIVGALTFYIAMKHMHHRVQKPPKQKTH